MSLILGTNCGFVTTRPVADPLGFGNWGVDNASTAIKVVAPAGVEKITEIGWWDNTDRPDADMDIGLYSHDSGNNKPGTLLASVTSSKGATAGWKYSSFNFNITVGTTYWLAVQVDNTTPTTITDYELSGGYFRWKSSQTELTNPWGANTFFPVPTQLIGIYAVWEGASTTVEPSTETLSLTLQSPTILIEEYQPLFTPWGHNDFSASAKPKGISLFWKGYIADEKHYEPHLSEYSGISTNLQEMFDRVVPTRGQTGPDVNKPLTPLLPHIKRNKDNHLAMFLEGQTLHNKTLFTRIGQKGARFGEGVESDTGLLHKWKTSQETQD